MSAADRRRYRKPHIADEGRDYDDRDAAITRLRAELAANKRVVDAARAVISNPAYQGICDEDVELEQAVAALAAKGDE